MLVAALASALLVLAQSITKAIGPGVTYTQEIRSSPPMVIHSIRAAPSKDGVIPIVALAGGTVLEGSVADGREPLSRIAARHRAVVATNGDYFPFTGDPLGMCIVEGDLVSEPARNRGVFGWTRDMRYLCGNPSFVGEATGPTGTKVPISGVNRSCGQGENVLWLPSGGHSFKSGNPVSVVLFRGLSLPFRLGFESSAVFAELRRSVTEFSIPRDGLVLVVRDVRGESLLTEIAAGGVWTFSLRTEDAVRWEEARFAISGGPWLVRNGSKYVDWREQGFAASHVTVRHPRTAVGHTANGELLLVVVEGRSPESSGMTLDELAEEMLRLGAVNALNLDGGGSSQLVVRDIQVSTPSDGSERPTANAVLLLGEEPAVISAGLMIEPKVVRGSVGEAITWKVTDKVTGEVLSNSEIVWGCIPGTGRIDQFGTFRPQKPGISVVSAYARGRILRSVVVVGPKKTESWNQNASDVVSLCALP